jgi:hypothetical protein
MKELTKPKSTPAGHVPSHFFSKEGVQESSGENPVPFFTSAGIQPKLEINEPGDSYEQQADQVADQVMTMPDMKLQMHRDEDDEDEPIQMKQISRAEKKEEEQPVQMEQISRAEKKEEEKPIQKEQIFRSEDKEDDKIQKQQIFRAEKKEEEKPIQKASVSGKDKDPDSAGTHNLEDQLHRTSGSGNPLPADSRQTMESHFGSDFSQVRVHTHPEAVQMNKDLNAKAFTHGSNIYFGSGYYDPGSSSGKHLLAHELTHVIQQSARSLSIPEIQRDGETQNIPNISTQIPVGLTPNQQGEFQTVINHINVIIRPDIIGRTRSRLAETQVTLEGGEIEITGTEVRRIEVPRMVGRRLVINRPRVKIVTSHSGPTPVTVIIRTVYPRSENPSKASTYGRGHTPADLAAGTISLRFHEGCHGADHLRYISSNPLPVFLGYDGTSERAFKRARRDYRLALRAYHNDMINTTIRSTDLRTPTARHRSIG